MDYPQTSRWLFRRLLSGASLAVMRPASQHDITDNTSRPAMATICRGPIPLPLAAYLLRLPPAAVKSAVLTGELPSIDVAGIAHVDGPALLISFRTPAASKGVVES